MDGARQAPFKRSDSVRSAAALQSTSGGGGLGNGAPESSAILRKSKTELSINLTKKRVNNSAMAGGGSLEEQGSVLRETASQPGEGSNCVLM